MTLKTLLLLLSLLGSGFTLRWMPTNELWLRHEIRDSNGNTSIHYLVGVGKDGVPNHAS